MRIPYMVTGRLYTSFLLYGYIDAFAMLVASRYASSGSSDLSYDAFKSVMIMVGASACTSATLLWLIKTRLMVQSFNWMWWSTRTPREQFSIWIWENNVYSQFGPDLNDHRARAISEGFRNEYYIHDLRVKEWLHSNWSEWEKDPPSWFDDVFIEAIPHEWIPVHARPQRQSGFVGMISKIKTIRRSAVIPAD